MCPPKPLMEYDQVISIQVLHLICPFAPFVLPPTAVVLKFLLYLEWAITFSKFLRAIVSAACYSDCLEFLLGC